uniref:NADH-ubiquinone oxidoreductase chain 2 n=1 Tax=Blaps rhynchoptera TaxID=1379410 RepID=A0A6H1XH08_BLARH|nr:NADH dehydrogenase subunit 2 [Blaps rhynchoptera]QJA14886.1 NADH dehydrogenase subunit 2 [Blaps rhynchoptera]QJA15156.1 NADH dehydrogenase subunit 2 [Blaps rhynchoptera]
MKLYKMMFFTSMVMGTILAISSYSWLSMWMGLEINLLSIIPLMSDSKNMYSSESSLKYFITQAMASMILLMAVIMILMTDEFINPLVSSSFSLMMNTALLTKLGAAPFHFWFPEVIEGLSWMNSLILLTWQKIAPMMLLMNNKMNTNFLLTIIFSSLIISTIMGFNQISLRKIMAFSSINHIAWMLSTMMISLSTWTIYFIIYSFININIITVMNSTKSFYLNQMINVMKKNKAMKLLFMMNFMSLGGLPPFIGFLPKWLVINWLVQNNLMTIAFLLIILTLIMLSIYLRTMMPSLMLTSSENKMADIKFKNPILMALNMTSVTSLFICTLIFSLI